MELSIVKSKLLSRKTMRLKDYLVDELSSCSSNGFRSYPRRQCCTSTTITTARRLVELDMKNMPTKFMKSKTHSKSSINSAFHRASNAIINAVKHLHFTSSFSSTSTLHRKLSRKLLKRCFTKKNDNVVEIPAVDGIKSGSQVRRSFTGCDSSGSSMSESNGENYSWSGSEFTASDHEYLRCSEVNNLNEKTKVNDERLLKNERVNATVIVGGEDSVEAISDSNSLSSSLKKPSKIEKENEHLSPISVLDFPFEDDEDEVSSHRFKGNTKLEPINLEKRIALSSQSSDDQDSIFASPLYASSQSSSQESIEFKAEDDKNNAEIKAFEYLQLTRDKTPSSSPMNFTDKLLFEFFKEGIEFQQMGSIYSVDSRDNELLNTAIDWLKGQSSELDQEIDVKKKMEACLGDMEKEGKWRKWDDDDEEKKEMVLELECEVFDYLVNEVLIDYYFFFP